MKSRSANFSPEALNQLAELSKVSPKLIAKLSELLNECLRSPFEGRGKPEPLKGDLSGYWSRRINDEHRLVYKVDDNYIYVFSCKGHYD
ncbi:MULTISPECIES: Txe/YoeB family addiction module toxin [Larkinella]|jgi:toxin YoeB|uniref:Putative mRNA interferase YoeB n=1 Tax=Larkinella humicola TaxID=2607654 RepID=A0A5N1JQJ9_9BACT|nr:MULTISPECIES: Txe/YoeB family addiction module toxin [Larkinella]KAA9356889.1 Txe/YoeB family addiction module toxin [Larkinella humicola]